MYVKKVDDLLIYKMALEYAAKIAELVKAIPYHWGIPEVNQATRSSSSVSANIAEGFSQRFYEKKFPYYLNIALGSSDETRDHLEKLLQKGHLDKEIAAFWIKNYKNLSVRIVNFMNHLIKRKQLQ